MKHNEIENIIFDLGGVIINLDIDATFQKFSKIFKQSVTSEIFTDHKQYKFFRDFEVGRIDDRVFREHIRRLARIDIEDAILDEAWNAMLRDIPEERISWIHDITKKYNCVVLSNTNSIHIRHFHHIFNTTTPHDSPISFFQKVFYSYEIGERKPDARAFEVVLDETGFDPSRTLVYDDLKENIETAQRLGMQTVYVERNNLKREQLPHGSSR